MDPLTLCELQRDKQWGLLFGCRGDDRKNVGCVNIDNSYRKKNVIASRAYEPVVQSECGVATQCLYLFFIFFCYVLYL